MTHFHRSRRVALAWLSSVLFFTLSACSVLPESETLTFYRLPSPSAALGSQSVQQPRSDEVLQIDTPYGDRAVDSTRLLVIPDPDRISAYKGARWSDRAPVLFRDRLIEAFRSAGVFRTVVADSSTLSADLELSGDLTWFHVVYRDGVPVVRIAYDANLSNVSSSRIVGSQRFIVEQPVQGKEVTEVVQAFGLALDKLSVRVLEWVQQQSKIRPDGR